LKGAIYIDQVWGWRGLGLIQGDTNLYENER
jgi:hypothetical protein